MFRRLTQFAFAALISIVLSAAWGGSAQAQYSITILRGVDANVATGTASRAPSQFVFTGNPPTLSLFDTAADAAAAGVNKPCYLRVVVDMPRLVLLPGDLGTIVANGHRFVVVFNSNPPGHWSILLGNYLQLAGRTDFSAYAIANPNFVNGFGLNNGVDCK